MFEEISGQHIAILAVIKAIYSADKPAPGLDYLTFILDHLYDVLVPHSCFCARPD